MNDQVRELKSCSVELPDGSMAISTSFHDYQYAVISRTQEPGQEFTGWYVSRYSEKLDNAKAYETYLHNCPSVKSGVYKWETQVVQVKTYAKETK